MTLTTYHDTKTVQELIDLFGKKRLNLSPAFQRQSVWGPSARELLVHSLLDKVPVPTIYLYRRVGAGGSPVYDVIDGKQRIEAILLFCGKGPLAKDEELWVKRAYPADAALDWWSWPELTKAIRHEFLTERLPTIEVEGEFNEIVDLFVRINSTGKSLTGQEKRHARYFSSPVLKTAQKVAERHRAYLPKHQVLPQSQVQRMKHVELVTELLLAIASGAHLNKKAKIDEIIRGDGMEDVDLQTASKDLGTVLRIITTVLPDLKTTRFRQLADFYSLVMIFHRYRSEGRSVSAHDSTRNALAGELLRDFGRGVDEVAEEIRKGRGTTALQTPFRDYLMTVREGTDTASQRRAREKLLDDVLSGVFDDLDAKRSFNSTQRRILWHASSKKRCAICKKPITRWEDIAIDHIEPYIKGGRTHLSNAALTHRPCNAAKGARSTRRRRRRKR